MWLFVLFCCVAAIAEEKDYRAYYRLFDRSGSPTKLRRQFRELALAYHPDKVKGTEADKAAAKKKFLLLSTAYNKLLARARSAGDGAEHHAFKEGERQRRVKEMEKLQQARRAKELRDYKEKLDRMLRNEWRWNDDDDDDDEQLDDLLMQRAAKMEEMRKANEEASRRRAAERERIRLRDDMIRRKLEEEQLQESKVLEYLFTLCVSVGTVMGVLVSYYCFALREEVLVETSKVVGKKVVDDRPSTSVRKPGKVKSNGAVLRVPESVVSRRSSRMSEWHSEDVQINRPRLVVERIEVSEEIIPRKTVVVPGVRSPRVARVALGKAKKVARKTAEKRERVEEDQAQVVVIEKRRKQSPA